MSIIPLLLPLLLFVPLFYASPSTSGVTVQFYYNRLGSCSRFPVAFDWWAGKALIGNLTGNFVGTCSIFDLTAIDSKNGRSFFYASGNSLNDYTSTIYTFVHRDSSGTVTVPKLVQQANTLSLNKPDALVYDPANDRLILVDTWNSTVYGLDYSTGVLSSLARMYNFNWACTSPVLSNNNLYCTWDLLYQINLQTGLLSTYPIYPPLVHQQTYWELAIGVDGVIQTDLYFIYWNPQAQKWANFIVETPTCNQFIPFDSNQTIFGKTSSNDEMNLFSLFAQGSSSVYGAMVRGGANSYYPQYLILYQLNTSSNTLQQVGISPKIAPIANQAMNANGGMMWDGYTQSQI